MQINRGNTALRASGFTLVEMAVVLLIISLLLTGLAPTLSSQIEQRRIRETQTQLMEIQQALIGFALINGRLPCPAQASLATGTVRAGMEATNGITCTCATAGGGVAQFGGVACTATSVTGVVPWATLGIRETDAWGRRFTYRVTTHFADSIGAGTLGPGCTATPPAASSFALCSKGNLNVKGLADSNLSVEIPAVFLSHGTNGAGAFDPSGSRLAAANDSDEVENTDHDSQFVSHEATTTYDDLVGWLSPSILFSKMVSAEKLP